MDLIPFMRAQIEGLKAKGKLETSKVLGLLPDGFDADRFIEGVASLCRVEADYLHPELKGVFRGSELVQKRCMGALDAVRRITEGGPTRWRALVDSGEAVAWVNTVFEHFEYVEREFLPKVRQHLATEQREELVQIMLDALQLPEGKGPVTIRLGQFGANAAGASARA